MKKAILFVLVLGFVLMGIMADAETKVELAIDTKALSTSNVVFSKSEITSMEEAAEATTISDGLTITNFNEGNEEASIDFYLTWYHYSPAVLEVTLKVGAMKTDTSYLPWTVTPSLGSNQSGTANSATMTAITAPEETGTTTKDGVVVSVKANSDNKMVQSYGNVKLSGNAVLTSAVTGNYSSTIIAEITSDN